MVEDDKNPTIIPINEDDWIRDLGQLRYALSRYKDESAILDHILFKSRELTAAEAGTVYLREADELVFAYIHNDFLFPVDSSCLYSYESARIPISQNSITGYVASTHLPLNLPNVHQTPAGSPYHYDDSYDLKTGYQTVSALTVPLLAPRGDLKGVLQLLNSLDSDGRPQAFTKTMETQVYMLAHEAAVTLEVSHNVRSGINRLMRIANLHDAAETGPHAERVGAVAAEIYQEWVRDKQKSREQIRSYKSRVRLAAMLHDIGKVGISDIILKKQGLLTDEEKGIMRSHTFLGSTLFEQDANDITDLALMTILHHHQKWDGSGYSGHHDVPVLAGLDIPLSARLTAVADVFDALVSPRCYKTAWEFEAAVDYVKSEAGHHFDPELVSCFLKIRDLVASIYIRYPDI